MIWCLKKYKYKLFKRNCSRVLARHDLVLLLLLLLLLLLVMPLLFYYFFLDLTCIINFQTIFVFSLTSFHK